MTPTQIVIGGLSGIAAAFVLLAIIDLGISDFYGGGGCPKTPPRL